MRFSTCLMCSAGGRFSGSVSPNSFDRFPHLLRDLLVGLNGLLLIVDLLAGQLVAGLGHAELVGGKLGGAHAVHELLFFGDAFPGLDGVYAQPAVKPLVSGVVKDAKHPVLHSGFAGGTRDGLELLGSLLPQFKPFQVGGSLVR